MSEEKEAKCPECGGPSPYKGKDAICRFCLDELQDYYTPSFP